MGTTRGWRGRVFIATSLDGHIARTDGDIAWLTDPPGDPGHLPPHQGPQPPPDYAAFIADVDHMVIGRGTYEKVLTFGEWPYGDLPVTVLSTTLTDGDDRVSVADALDGVLALLDDGGATDVYVDGGQVIQTFLRHDLIDEMTITTAPVLLGGGLPLFGSLDADVRLTLRGTAVLDDGMVSSCYDVVRAARPDPDAPEAAHASDPAASDPAASDPA